MPHVESVPVCHLLLFMPRRVNEAEAAWALPWPIMRCTGRTRGGGGGTRLSAHPVRLFLQAHSWQMKAAGAGNSGGKLKGQSQRQAEAPPSSGSRLSGLAACGGLARAQPHHGTEACACKAELGPAWLAEAEARSILQQRMPTC